MDVDGFETLAAAFSARLTENLDGRRVLACHSGLEPEPATLAQLPSMRRIHDVLPTLRARDRAAAQTAEHASGAIVAALVAEAAGDPDRHVATWPAAEQALGALVNLLELLAVDPSRVSDLAPSPRSN